MPLIVKSNETQFEPAPEGLWPAVCVDVVDLGSVETKFGTKPMLKIIFQIEERDDHGKRFQVHARFGQSLHAKSRLRPVLEAWRGRKFTPEELAGFDLEKLVGACAQVQVVHSIRDEGGYYANLQAVVPFAKGATKLAPEDYVRAKDRDQQQGTGSAPANGNDEEIPF
jgi:hypothetical protein